MPLPYDDWYDSIGCTLADDYLADNGDEFYISQFLEEEYELYLSEYQDRTYETYRDQQLGC